MQFKVEHMPKYSIIYSAIVGLAYSNIDNSQLVKLMADDDMPTMQHYLLLSTAYYAEFF